ncbi:MAG: hypothetical protein GF355_03580 [Candidatus Eisenbacteria bacterium]|nr:hypothetical protein [Candidatus Eisenbacteria bacterium]
MASDRRFEAGNFSMENVLSFLNHLLPVLYAAAWVNYSVYFVRDDPFAQRTATPFLLATAGIHILYIGVLVIAYRHHPMADVFEILSVVALAMSLVYLTVEWRTGNKATGVFILPVVCILQFISSVWISPVAEIDPFLDDVRFGLHSGTVALGYSAFFLAAVYGFMYHLMYRALRRKKFGRIFERLPSLDVLARMTRGATLVGFIFLSLAIAFGISWASGLIPRYYYDPKFITTLLVWLVYGFALLSHYVLRWTGRRVVQMSLVGFAVMVAAILIVNLFLPSFHRFGG